MGIDIYLKPENVIINDEQLYSSGVYIRESYHGGPYPSKYLFKECFENEESEYYYDSETLESRILETLHLAIIRMKNIYSFYCAKDIMNELYQYTNFIKNLKSYENQNIKCKVCVSW